ncbi:AAA family ATPase [Actinosynnema sp. CA-299493]
MSWTIYSGDSKPHDGIERLPPPPPWRAFNGEPLIPPPPSDESAFLPSELHQALAYQAAPDTIQLINAALYLRRPLLVTGPPGAGKSTLAYAVAHELKLGSVLYWPITSRSTLQDGLYQYDPLARLYAASKSHDSRSTDDIGRYLRLGPLGTALLPYERPRVLLIDEIDKCDIDLPNDLLTVFEKGQYEIPELTRVADTQPTCELRISHYQKSVTITQGVVRCREFPLVIMTSNGEREFPPAFLRRCVTVELRDLEYDQLAKVVEAHLGELAHSGKDLIDRFLERKQAGELATDQLLNAIYLVHHAARAGSIDRKALADRVLPYLSGRISVTADEDLDDD